MPISERMLKLISLVKRRAERRREEEEKLQRELQAMRDAEMLSPSELERLKRSGNLARALGIREFNIDQSVFPWHEPK
jgi:hypothetical protein